MLGQPGSSPIELFWDLVEDIYEELYAIRKKLETEFKVRSHTLASYTVLSTTDYCYSFYYNQEKQVQVISDMSLDDIRLMLPEKYVGGRCEADVIYIAEQVCTEAELDHHC